MSFEIAVGLEGLFVANNVVVLSMDHSQDEVVLLFKHKKEPEEKAVLSKIKQQASLHPSPVSTPVSYIKTTFPIREKLLHEGVSLLHLAAYNGWNDVINELVLRHECDVHCEDSRRCNPLHYAASNGQMGTVDHLLKSFKCNLMHKSEDGLSPLHFAVKFGHLNVIQHLQRQFSVRCDDSMADKKGRTPLHLACENGHLEVTKYLITEQFCDKNCKCNEECYESTPLHLASRRGHVHIVKYLIEEQYCDPMITTNEGNTPLHLACIDGHADVVEYLLTVVTVEKGDYRNKLGITPKDYASTRDDILKLLNASTPLALLKVPFPILICAK